jgi:hypothetical protein
MASVTRAAARKRRSGGWGRELSRHQVKRYLAIGQQWSDRNGVWWTVRQIHRMDGHAELQAEGYPCLLASFDALGRDYRLEVR